MTLPTWLLVLLTVLAVARLTRLLTEDVIMRPLRHWLIRRRPAPADGAGEDWLVYLIHCRWCASIWISFPTAAAVYLWHGHWPVTIGLVALASSPRHRVAPEARELIHHGSIHTKRTE